VGGGNTANMLAVWRLHGLDVILREAWEAGVVMCGMSAGSLCWFEGGTTDSFGLDLSALRDGLGFLAGSFSPHYDGEAKRRPAYHRFIADGELANGMAADNGVGVHFVGTEFDEALSVHEGLHAFRVELVDGKVQETAIEPRVLPRV
jgi:peptidase E